MIGLARILDYFKAEQNKDLIFNAFAKSARSFTSITGFMVLDFDFFRFK